MQTKRNFLKTSIAIACGGGLGMIPMLSRAAPVTKWLASNMPHYHEFNPAENPSRNGWCGHTVLKITGQYVSGQVKTLNQIHNTFYANSASYRANRVSGGFQWCAALQDLMWAAGLAQNGGYNRVNVSQAVTLFSSAADLFTKVKTAINANQPVIVPSNWYYTNVGHFWVIVGYTDWGSPAGSALYLRDVAVSAPVAANADRTVDVVVFFNASPAHQMLIMK